MLLEVEIKCQHESLHSPFAITKHSPGEWKTIVSRNFEVENWVSVPFGRMVDGCSRSGRQKIIYTEVLDTTFSTVRCWAGFSDPLLRKSGSN